MFLGEEGCRFGEVEDNAVFYMSVFDLAGKIVGGGVGVF
jgi:hypothetical protein